MAVNGCNFKGLNLTDETSFSYDERILEAQYREGNAQRAYDGTNHTRVRYNLEFVAMNDTEVQTLKDFYKSVGLVEYFFWCPIGEIYTATEADGDDEREAWRFLSPVQFVPFGSTYSTASAMIEDVNGYFTSETSCPADSALGKDNYYTADPASWPTP